MLIQSSTEPTVVLVQFSISSGRAVRVSPAPYVVENVKLLMGKAHPVANRSWRFNVGFPFGQTKRFGDDVGVGDGVAPPAGLEDAVGVGLGVLEGGDPGELLADGLAPELELGLGLVFGLVLGLVLGLGLMLALGLGFGGVTQVAPLAA